MSAEEVLRDLEERLSSAGDALYRLADNAGRGTHAQYRLEGKREGVLLAKSYVDEVRRSLGVTP